MMQFLNRFQVRELILCEVTLLVLICVPLTYKFILPAYDEWVAMRDQIDLRYTEHDRLTTNLSIRSRIDDQFTQINPNVLQTGSDQVTLSQFLRGLENTIGKHPSMIMINAKPLPVKEKDTHNVYRVSITVAGKLQDVVEFVNEVADGDEVVGIDSYSARGVQGDNIVECSMELRMIRLVPDDQSTDEEPIEAHSENLS